MTRPLLSVRDLTVAFPTRAGPAAVVDRVSFDLAAGEVLGIVGESGSGKSLTALSILRLIARPGRIAGGTILFDGRDLLAEPESAMGRLRGAAISMIFQEPMSSLNPVFPIGDQIMEPLRQHRGMDRQAARRAAIELLDMVEIPDARRRIDEFPHQLSGGMRQRVMIAIALACRPQILIADEPTTALDVTIQAQILDLLGGLQRELGMAVLLITHDLGVVAQFARRAMVMYAGAWSRRRPCATCSGRRPTPTRGARRLDAGHGWARTPLRSIAGSVPQAAAMPPGCRFAPRCAEAHPACSAGVPPSIGLGQDRTVACLLHAASVGAA